MASIAVRPPAGVGALAAIQTDSTGLRGRFRVLTGSSGLAAGPLVIVTLDQQPVADVDAIQTSLGNVNATLFTSPDVIVTPWTIPPVGCAFQEVAQLVEGRLVGFAVATTLPLVAGAEYRFGWRVEV
jgi:hypothetical protein